MHALITKALPQGARTAVALVLVWALWPASTPAAGTPALFSAEYTVLRNDAELGKNRRTLMRGEDDRYVYRSETESTGALRAVLDLRIIEESRFSCATGQMRPHTYTYRRDTRFKDKATTLNFQWKGDAVRVTGTESPVAAQAPVYDELLLHLALMRDVKRGRNELNYNVVDNGRVKTYQFSIAGREILETPLGPLEAIRLSRHTPERRTTIWLAPELGYLPAQIEQYDGDEHLLLKISGYTSTADV